MKAKWKLFMVLNLVLAVPALILFVTAVIRYINHPPQDNISNIILFVFFPCLLIVMINGILNVYITQAFYPDRSLPKVVKALNVTFLVLYIITAIVTLIIDIAGAREEFGAGENQRDSLGKVAVIVILAGWIIQVMIIVMQIQLSSLLKRNSREKMNALIDSIGQ